VSEREGSRKKKKNLSVFSAFIYLKSISSAQTKVSVALTCIFCNHLLKMTIPQIIEVDGCGQTAKTWVADVKFAEVPDQFQMGAFVTTLRDKPYHVGIVDLGLQKYHLIFHGKGRPIRNSQCKDLIQTVFERAHFKYQIEQLAAFNGYHMEVFGFSKHPTYEEPEEQDPEELNPDDQEDLGKLYETAEKKDDLEAIYQDYIKKHNQSAIALGTKLEEKVKINWITDMPPTLEVVTKRSLREWQKLEWVLHRDRAIYGDDTLRTCPTIGHWEQFYKLYYDISPVGEPRKRREQAFKTFADHVKAVTGMVVTKEDLQKTGPEQKVLRNGACYQCENRIPMLGDMDGQFYTNMGMVVARSTFDKKEVKDESVYGIFCSRRCASGRCLGCAGGLVDGKCTSIWCGDDQKRNKREAVPLGYGIDGYDEYIGEMEASFAQKGLPLDWPMCRAKRQCFWHGCNHVCKRDCQHECTAKRRQRKMNMGAEPVKYGHPLCSCEPEWFEWLEQIEPDSKRQRV